jgi:hypothetical protein
MRGLAGRIDPLLGRIAGRPVWSAAAVADRWTCAFIQLRRMVQISYKSLTSDRGECTECKSDLIPRYLVS